MVMVAEDESLISLRRMLSAAEERGDTGRGLDANWVKELHRLYKTAFTEGNEREEGSSSRESDEYSSRIKRISEAIRRAEQEGEKERPAYCKGSSMFTGGGGNAMRPKYERGADASMATERVGVSSRRETGREQQGVKPVILLGAEAETSTAQVSHQSRVHEELTSDLAELATRLKASVHNVADAVKERDSLLDAASEHASKNVDGVKQSVARSKSLYSKGWSTGCTQWLLLILVGIVFTMMFVFIRFTSMMGMKGEL